jgi:putative ABC transport system substrate-binding protein
VHAQTRTPPIIVITGRDIVEAGLADSLAHPGGIVTGIVNLGGELDGKRLELLHELVPAARGFRFWHIFGCRGVLFARPPSTLWRARSACGSPRDWSAKHEKSTRLSPPVPPTTTRQFWWKRVPQYFQYQPRLLALAAQYRLPAVYERRELVEAAVFVLGTGLPRELRACCRFDKILKGAKPADLPVE